jgi:hypothetical protein
LLRGTLFQFGMFQVLFDFLSQVHWILGPKMKTILLQLVRLWRCPPTSITNQGLL